MKKVRRTFGSASHLEVEGKKMTITVELTFEQLVQAVKTLSPQERETLLALLRSPSPWQAEDQSLLAMTAQADPVLAELWNNPKDAAYDRL